MKDKVKNILNLQYQEHWTKLGKTITEITEKKIGLVNNKKIKQWFNKNCKIAVQKINKSKSLVVMESIVENNLD